MRDEVKEQEREGRMEIERGLKGGRGEREESKE